MFFHDFKYSFLLLIRNKVELFWLLAFPIILGTFFYFAFGNLYDTTERFSEIPVAVVADDSINSEAFKAMTEMLEKADTPIIKAEYTDNDTALEMLKNGVVDAVVYADKDDVRMSVTTSEINQTIVKSIVDTFRTNRKVIADTIENDPALITSVIESMTEQVSYNKEIDLSGGNMDFYIQYFYNLIAMICMLSCNTGLAIVVNNQANLSALGARKSVSPISNTSKLMAGFISTVCVNLIIIAIVMSYLIFILGIDFGSKIAPLFLAVFIGTIMGTSLGFFVGAFGNMKQTTKTSLLTGVSLTLCALSGLMADSLPKMINRYCPIVNKINPAAILTDCFYALNIYDTYERFGFNLIKIAAYSAVFIVCGMTMLRRKKYASI